MTEAGSNGETAENNSNDEARSDAAQPEVDAQADASEQADAQVAEDQPGMSVPDDLSGLEDVPAGAEEAPAGETDLAAERLEDLQRLNAEYAAFRMRAKREQERATQQGMQSALEALIPVLDEVKLARDNGDVTGAFESHVTRLFAALEKVGFEQYGEAGEVFDPEVHEALMQQPSDEVEEPQVFAVMQPGYRLGGRVIRAARVGVHAPEE